MLVIANLLGKQEYQEAIEFMAAVAGEEGKCFVKNMDSTTESISLGTNSLDDLPPECLEYIKAGMEVFLEQFGTLLLSAVHFSMGSGKMDAIQAVQEGIDFMARRISEAMIGEG